MTRNVLSIDLGTSRVKLGVVNDRLEVLAAASAHYSTYADEADMAEQRPEEWLDAIGAAWGEVGATGSHPAIDAIVLTAQMPTLVELDDGGHVMGRAVTWQDSRAESIVNNRLSADERRRVRDVAGAPIDGRYLIPMCLRRRLAGLPEPTTILSAKDYIFFVLTGRFFTDPSTASGFGNYDLAAQNFSEELTALWGVDAHRLPTVEASNSWAMLDQSRTVVLDGLEPQRIPVVLGSADSVAAFHFVERTFGTASAVIDGSSTVILSAADERGGDHSRLLVTPLVDGARHGVEMDLLATGSSITWLADLFDRTTAELEDLALSVDDKVGNPILFTPYLAGGEQGALWRTDLSGTISNVRLGASQGDIALALYEGIAFEVLRCLDVVASPSTVVWLVSAENEGLLPSLVRALGERDVVTVAGLSPSLLGAALIALEVLHEKPDLRSLRAGAISSPLEWDQSYVSALRDKRSRYLAAEERGA